MKNAIRIFHLNNQFAGFNAGNGVSGICHVDNTDGSTTVLLDSEYVLGIYKNQFLAMDAIHNLCDAIHCAEVSSGQCRRIRSTSSVTITGTQLLKLMH